MRGLTIAGVVLALAVSLVVLAAVAGMGPARLLPAYANQDTSRLAVTRFTYSANEVQFDVLNEGGAPLTIAQVAVDYAFWQFTASPSPTVAPQQRVQVTVPYRWVAAEQVSVRLFTTGGRLFEVYNYGSALEIERPSRRFYGIVALVSVYAPIVAVVLGVLLSRSREGAALAARLLPSMGLAVLVLLLAEGLRAAFAAAANIPGRFAGVLLLVVMATASYFFSRGALPAVMAASMRTTASTTEQVALSVVLALGLHNLAEGMALGAALLQGELAFGTAFIVALAAHQLAQALPLSAAGITTREAHWNSGRLLGLSLVASLPLFVGAWLGGFANSPMLAVAGPAAGAGALAHAAWQLLGFARGGVMTDSLSHRVSA